MIKYSRVGLKNYFFNLETEKEIYNGIIKTKTVSENVLCFLREIDDIEESVRKNLNIAKTYIDVDRNNKIDDASKLLLNDLKTNKIKSKLPDANLFKFNVTLYLFAVFKKLFIANANFIGKT